MDNDDATKITEFLLNTIQSFAVQSLGQEAAMNMIEVTLIGTSLPKLLTSLETSTVERLSGVLYPVMGIMGFGLYGLRVAAIYKTKTEQENNTPQPNNTTQTEKQETKNEEINQEWNQKTPLPTHTIMNKSDLPL